MIEYEYGFAHVDSGSLSVISGDYYTSEASARAELAWRNEQMRFVKDVPMVLVRRGVTEWERAEGPEA